MQANSQDAGCEKFLSNKDEIAQYIRMNVENSDMCPGSRL